MKFYFRWLMAWIELIESVLKILTLGFLRPLWSFNLCFYFTMRRIKKREG